MAEIITHSFVSAKTQNPDTTLVSKNEWNDGHVFSGGINGQVLLYDNTQPNNMRWVNKTLAFFTGATVSISTATPLSGQASTSVTLETSAIALITMQVGAYTSVGNAAGTLTAVVDSLDVFTLGVASPLTQYSSVSNVLNLTAGTHNFSIRLNTVGNVNVTAFSASLVTFIIGV